MAVNEHMVPRQVAKNQDIAEVQMVRVTVAAQEVMHEVATDRKEHLSVMMLQKDHITEAKEVPVARKHQDHSMKNQNELIHRVMKTGQLLKMDRNVHTTEVKVVVNVQDHPVMVTDQNVLHE